MTARNLRTREHLLTPTMHAERQSGQRRRRSPEKNDEESARAMVASCAQQLQKSSCGRIRPFLRNVVANAGQQTTLVASGEPGGVIVH
jgi:hypothetical protein